MTVSALALLLVACTPAPEVLTLEGATMGTRYHITVVNREHRPVPANLQSELESLLEEVNSSMSTYREDSLIHRFNTSPPGGPPLSIDPHFAAVLRVALQIGTASGGAYDVTAGPLVNLWGFGADSSPGNSVPGEAAIAEAKSRTGQQWLGFISQPNPQAPTLTKGRPLSLDFSSVAKGYAVDLLAEHIASWGFADYMVEIGGELKVSGNSPRGTPWRIAVEQPNRRVPAATLALNSGAVATSGDYRNYFEVEGIRYSHLIDPRTGRPVRHELVSVTVVHDTCAEADAWATALTVLGLEAALETAAAHHLAAYFITRDGAVHKTPAIALYLHASDLR